MTSPEQIVRDLERTLPVMREEAVRAMHAAVDLTKTREAERMPRRSGKLIESLRGTVRENQTGVSGTVRPASQHAGFVDKGTGLLHESGFHHPITSNQGRKVLRFVGRDGQIYFRRSVKGQRPQAFVERTRGDVAVEVEALLTSGAVKATERLFPL